VVENIPFRAASRGDQPIPGTRHRFKIPAEGPEFGSQKTDVTIDRSGAYFCVAFPKIIQKLFSGLTLPDRSMRTLSNTNSFGVH